MRGVWENSSRRIGYRDDRRQFVEEDRYGRQGGGGVVGIGLESIIQSSHRYAQYLTRAPCPGVKRASAHTDQSANPTLPIGPDPSHEHESDTPSARPRGRIRLTTTEAAAVYHKVAAGNPSQQSRSSTWLARWEAAMQQKGVPRSEWYVPAGRAFELFNTHFLAQAPHQGAAGGYVQSVAPMRAALNARAASSGSDQAKPGHGPWSIEAVNAAVDHYATAVARIQSAERRLNEAAGTPVAPERQRRAPPILEATLQALVRASITTRLNNEADAAGLIAGSAFVPLLFCLRANSVGASHASDDLIFNGNGAHLRLRRMKQWSRMGRECKGYPGGTIDLRKQVWLRVPWGDGEDHPRSQMLRCIQFAHREHTLAWIMGGGDDEEAADAAFEVAAAKAISVMRDSITIEQDGVAIKLRDAGAPGQPITSHSPRKTAVAIMRAGNVSYETIRARGLWRSAATVERYYAPHEQYECSSWAKSLFDYVRGAAVQGFLAHEAPTPVN